MPSGIIEIQDSLPHFEVADEQADTFLVPEPVMAEAARNTSKNMEKDELMERFEGTPGVEAEPLNPAPRLC